MHSINRYRIIIRSADVALWHACATVATWHAGMRIVLLSTHPTEIDQARPKNQFGTGTGAPLIYPQHSKVPCRHYENGRAKICAHLCVCRCARLHCTPGHCEKSAATWGGTQCEITAHMCRARGVCSCAARACGAVQMQQDSHAGRGGCKYEALRMGGVVQGRLRHHVRCPPSGRRGWHLRAANKRIETCARTADMSGMIMCMGGMQQTACHEHV
jgi:hypothetical protein